MNAKSYSLGLGTLGTAVLLAFAAIFTVSTTSYAQSGKRICKSHSGGGDYIIEVNRGAVCGKHWWLTSNGKDARSFQDKMITCEAAGRWSSTHSFGRSDDDICDGMETAKRRSGQYHDDLSRNGYGWGYIGLVCPDFSTTIAQMLWCEAKMDQFKQVISGLYQRKTGKKVSPSSGRCRDRQHCFSAAFLGDIWKRDKNGSP